MAQFVSGQKMKVFGVDADARHAGAAADLATTIAMADLERPHRFVDLEAHPAAQAAALNHRALPHSDVKNSPGASRPGRSYRFR